VAKGVSYMHVRKSWKLARLGITGLGLAAGLVLGATSQAQAATLNVNNGGTCNDGTGSPAYCTIQSAIDAASNGDTIEVAAGTYALTGGININKSVILRGAQADIDPRPSGFTPRTPGGPAETIVSAEGLPTVFSINASSVEINGFDLKNASTAIIDSDGATLLNDLAIRNNLVHNTTVAGGAKGIRIRAITGAVIEYNNVYTVADSGIEIGATAAGASTGAQVRFNEVHDLGSGGSTNSAIYGFLVGSSDTVLNATFKGNLVYNHYGNDAIKLGAKNGQDSAFSVGSIEDNIVHDVAQDGITVVASSASVVRNEVYNSFSDNGAIYVYHGATGVTVNNNYVHDNTANRAAILIGAGSTSPTNVTASGNSIVDNAQNKILFRDITGGTAILNASGNWYGSATASTVATANQSTVNNVASTNRIDFTPFLGLGTDAQPATPGFQPTYSALTVVPSTVSVQSGVVTRINEGIALAATSGVVTVATGTYTEDFNLNKNVTVSLTDASTVVNGTGTVSNGILTGLGSVTTGVSASGGTIAPGIATGDLTVGTLGLGAGSTLSLNIAGASNDRVITTGAVTLTNATLALVVASAPTSPITIINNGSGSPVIGTFNGLNEGAALTVAGKSFRITYVGGDGNDVSIAQVYSISGLVRTSSLVPVSGVTITSTGGIGPAVTDASGYYLISNVPAGLYTLTPSKAGYTFSPTSQGLSVTTGPRAANFIATSTATVFQVIGRLQTSGGIAISGGSVSISPVPGGVGSPVISNGAGYYTFSNVPNGSYTLTATKAGTVFAPLTRNVIVGGADVIGQNFIGSTGYTITGRVANSSGTGLSGISVAISGGPTVTTNGAGYYTFTNVVNGSYTITPSFAGTVFAPANRNITVSGADQSNLNFVGSTGFTVTGRIATSGGMAIVGVSVQLDGGASVLTNGAGYFTINNVADGAHTLTPTKGGYTFTPAVKNITVSGGNLTNQNITGSNAP